MIGNDAGRSVALSVYRRMVSADAFLLYYTPGEVTIDVTGIRPDVEAPMGKKEQVALLKQMYDSIKDDSKLLNLQNHGAVTGNGGAPEASAEDIKLKRAVEILKEDPVFEHLTAKYHKDTHETQVAAPADQVLKQGPDAGSPGEEVESPEQEPESPAPAPPNP